MKNGTVLFAVAGVLLALLLVPGAGAQPSDPAHVKLAQAKEAYQLADYEQAIDLFAQIAQNTERDRRDRREALRYLGRTYVVKNDSAKACNALRQLMKLEPPLVEFDPDREPPPLVELYYEVRKEKMTAAGSTPYAVPKRQPGLQTLAIMDFSSSSTDRRFDPLRKGLSSMMINYLSGATCLQVIERERIQWLLGELELQQQRGVVDDATAVRMGKLLGAHAVVFGSYIVHKDRMWLSARVVKVETGEILLAEKILGEPDEFFSLIQGLSRQVAEAVGELPGACPDGPPALPDGEETSSLEAMMDYSEGLALLEEGRYRAAYEKFQEAQEHDPGYKRAEIKQRELRRILAATDAGAPPLSGTNK